MLTIDKKNVDLLHISVLEKYFIDLYVIYDGNLRPVVYWKLKAVLYINGENIITDSNNDG